MRCVPFLLLPVLLVACGEANKTAPVQEPAYADTQWNPFKRAGREVSGEGQLTAYVRRIFQDSKGRFWFGSNS